MVFKKKKVEKDYKVLFIRLDKGLHAEIARICIDYGVSMHDLVHSWLGYIMNDKDRLRKASNFNFKARVNNESD